MARFAAVMAFAMLAASAQAAGKQKIYVTNSAGNDIHVIDGSSLEVVGHVEVGPQPHGICAPPSGRIVYIAIEAMGKPAGELVWFDPATDKVTKRLTIGPEPNQLACTPDGNFVYIPCKDGNYWVVDAVKAEVVAKVRTGGRPHNTLCSADGKHMYLSPLGAPKRVFIAETATHSIVGEIPFSSVTRPIALAPDEKRIYAQVDGLIGFEVADIASRKMIHRVAAEIPEALRSKASRSHGLAARPDGKEVWSCDSFHARVNVFDVTVDPPKQIADIETEGPVYWLFFTPDGKHCLVSEREANKLAIVDTASKKVVRHIPVGKVPKRTWAVVLPESPK